MKKKRIMIVEDEAISAMLLRKRCEEWGWEVVGVEGTGRGAISLAARVHLDAILMDIRLKDEIDGIEAARTINCNIPVIFHTAYTDEITRRRAEKLSPTGFLEKPVRDSQLSEVLQSIQE